MVWGLRSGATVAAVVVLLGGYLTADAFDVVPGLLTTADPWPQPNPFPEAPGAAEGPAVAPLLGTLSDQAPAPSPSDVGDLVGQVATDPRLGSRVGVVVQDAITGETLASHDPDQQMVPASTQKVLTAVAALSSPLADRTLRTRALLEGGTLYLVGGGDMMLAAQAGDPTAVLGRAGLADLADQVAAELLLTGQTTVRLTLDDTLVSGAFAPSVQDRYRAAGYVAPVAALGLNIGSLQDGYHGSGQRASDPAMFTAQEFVERLAERGVTVEGSVVRAKVPSGADELGMVESAPVRDVVEFFLQTSDNTVTEVVGRLVAVEAGLPGTVDGATQAVTAAVTRLGVDLTDAKLTDCSGLGDGSRITPAQLADVVALLVDPANPRLRGVAVGMPVAGLDGTLANRFKVPNDGRGLVRAKTGSLENVTALSGTVVTADDRQLVFVVIADQYPSPPLDAQAAVDQFVGRLAALTAG